MEPFGNNMLLLDVIQVKIRLCPKIPPLNICASTKLRCEIPSDCVCAVAPEEEQERTSPSIRSAQSGVSVGDAAAYEDDFVSSRSSGVTGQSKKRYSGHSR